VLGVSVIATVRNEAGAISNLLDTLAGQTRAPDEIVIVDGGSTDSTLEIIRAHPLSSSGTLKLIEQPGANISQGRNAAIGAATGEIIASTDAGVRLGATWLAELIRPFEERAPAPDVVSGFFLPDATTPFEIAMGATVLPSLSDIDPARFNPSSRSVAFRRSAWQGVGGYPEWLDYCEDLIFDFNLRAAGYRFHFAPEAVVYFRPRSTLAAFFRQYYRYARGDGKADIWRKRHAIRYATYLVALPLLLLLGIADSRWWWLLLLLGGAAMLWTPYRRLIPALGRLDWRGKLKAILWTPVIRVSGDIAKMIGYPVGLWWRRSHRRSPPD
jgi:cellulose synthase/poly-beta-1,6-N-acetylglucosamine synthase-like glycosyltransferase